MEPPAITTASQPQAKSGSALQPSVIVSLSSDAAASAQAKAALPSTGAGAVLNALSWATGANGFADIAAHFDYAGTVADFGVAIANRNKAIIDAAAADSASFALSDASSLGIPIKDSVSPEAIKNGATPGTITVSAFSFTDGSSTYAVTPGKDGTLIGTKDGQAWQTWQLISPGNAPVADSGAATALATLNAIAGQKSSANHSTSFNFKA